MPSDQEQSGQEHKEENDGQKVKGKRGRKSTIDLDVLGGILSQQNREETS